MAAHINCAALDGMAALVYIKDKERSTTTKAAPSRAQMTPEPYSAMTVGRVPKMPEPTIQPIPISNAPIKPIFFFSFVSISSNSPS